MECVESTSFKFWPICQTYPSILSVRTSWSFHVASVSPWSVYKMSDYGQTGHISYLLQFYMLDLKTPSLLVQNNILYQSKHLRNNITLCAMMLRIHSSTDDLSTIDMEAEIMTEPIIAVNKTWRTLRRMVQNAPKLSGICLRIKLGSKKIRMSY